jgi:uncharacterized protein
MRYRKVFSILFIILILFSFAFAQEIKFPRPRGYVDDFANIISEQVEYKIEGLLSSLEKVTTAQVAVVTVSSIAPYDIELYAVKLFETWGIGKKGKDNGVLLLVAVKERKVRIEVGYGLEGALPDAICKQIIENYIIPYFKKDNFSDGILAGVSQIVKYVAREYGISPDQISGYKDYAPPRSRGNPLLGFIIYLILLFIFVRIFGIFGIFFLPSGGGYWGGGGGGFGGFGGFGGGMSGGGGASGSW